MAAKYKKGVRFIKDGMVGEVIAVKDHGRYIIGWHDKHSSTSTETGGSLRGAKIIKGEI